MEKKSTTKKVRSCFVKAAKYDTDFCPIHANSAFNSLYYNIFFIPRISPGTPPPLQWKSLWRKSSRWFPHHFSLERSIKDAINTYKLASYCGALIKEKHLILAGICLWIAWLYRINQTKEQEERFMKFALKEYEASYSTGNSAAPCYPKPESYISLAPSQEG